MRLANKNRIRSGRTTPLARLASSGDRFRRVQQGEALKVELPLKRAWMIASWRTEKRPGAGGQISTRRNCSLEREWPQIRLDPARPRGYAEQPRFGPERQQPLRTTILGRHQLVQRLMQRPVGPVCQPRAGGTQGAECDGLVIATRVCVRHSGSLVVG